MGIPDCGETRDGQWKDSELVRLGRRPICEAPERDDGCRVDDWNTASPCNWIYYRCLGYSVDYLDLHPNRQSTCRLYKSYYTHAPTQKRTRRGLGKLELRNGYMNWNYGYRHQPALAGGRWFVYLLPPWLRWRWDYFARHLPRPELGPKRLLDVG